MSNDTEWTFMFERSLAKQSYDSADHNHVSLNLRSQNPPTAEAYATLQEITNLITKFSMQMKTGR